LLSQNATEGIRGDGGIRGRKIAPMTTAEFCDLTGLTLEKLTSGAGWSLLRKLLSVGSGE